MCAGATGAHELQCVQPKTKVWPRSNMHAGLQGTAVCPSCRIISPTPRICMCIMHYFPAAVVITKLLSNSCLHGRRASCAALLRSHAIFLPKNCTPPHLRVTGTCPQGFKLQHLAFATSFTTQPDFSLHLYCVQGFMHYFVKRLLTTALDRNNREREMASVALSSLYANVIPPDQVRVGFCFVGSFVGFCFVFPGSGMGCGAQCFGGSGLLRHACRGSPKAAERFTVSPTVRASSAQASQTGRLFWQQQDHAQFRLVQRWPRHVWQL